MRVLTENLPDQIYFKDTRSRFTWINKWMANRFHLTNPRQAVGKTDFDFFTEEHARQAYEDEQRILKTGEPILGIEEKETWPDGHETWVSTNKLPLRNRNGRIIGTYGISRNITDLKHAEELLRNLSYTDELTGLLNRRGFAILAQQQEKFARRMKHKMMMLFVDVDDLKIINDSLGHSQGDNAIRETASILKETFREADILSRIGGDEFVVLALESSKASADCIAARLQDVLDAHNRRHDRPFFLSLSIGVANYDPSMPCSVEDLIVKADGMMYQQRQAKKTHGAG